MKPLLFILLLSLSAKSCDETKHIYVADHLADCVGVAPQKCMLVKDKVDDNWSNFYDNIEGFTYEEGYEYLLKVEVETIKNPPADASSLKYTLVEVLEKNKTQQEQDSLVNKWKVVSMSGVDKFEKNPTISFDKTDNQISGFAGCNNFFGKYDPSNNQLKLSQMGLTRKMCPDMTVENAFINNLRDVSYYKIEGDKLNLFNENDDLIISCIKE
ncbi:MAG: DUF4377 domain-containing protein [Bacteroidota bacterium]